MEFFVEKNVFTRHLFLASIAPYNLSSIFLYYFYYMEGGNLNKYEFFSVCIGELIETEEEFGKDIQRVVEQYLTPLEEEIRPAPRTVKDNKDLIFNNLKQISAFHNG